MACYRRLIGFWCRFSRARTRVVGHTKSRVCHWVPLHSTLWTVNCLINIYHGNLKILTLLDKASFKKLNLFSYYYFRFDFLLWGIGWGEIVRFIQFEVLDSNSILQIPSLTFFQDVYFPNLILNTFNLYKNLDLIFFYFKRYKIKPLVNCTMASWKN